MRASFNPIIPSLIVLMLALAGCSGKDEVSGAAAGRLCRAACEKSSTCVSIPVAVDCDMQCSASAGGSGHTECDVSSSQVNECAAALEAQSCEDFTAGNTPAACDFCPRDTPDASRTPDASGTPDASSSIPDASVGSGFDAATSGATCEDLAACCSEIADAGTRMGCEQVVDLGGDGTCAAALSGLIATEACSS